MKITESEKEEWVRANHNGHYHKWVLCSGGCGMKADMCFCPHLGNKKANTWICDACKKERR